MSLLYCSGSARQYNRDMSTIPVQQALFHRQGDNPPVLQARSVNFPDGWVAEAERMVVGFGARTGSLTSSIAIFALPLTPKQVAVVRVAEQPSTGLGFHMLAIERSAYERYAGDPFAVARRLPATW